MRHPKRSISRDIRTRRPLHPGREADELEAVTWPEGLRVKQFMTRSPVTIHPDALVKGAADMMRTRKLRHLPVVDRGGRLIGIVTDRDLRQVIFDPAVQARLGRAADALQTLAVRDVMTWGVVTVRPETTVRDAAWLMREQRLGALPVVQAGRLVGILTERDVLRAFEEALGTDALTRPYRWAFSYR
ncbi:MAG TPA: CBS domain-containing protein [Methylomirabilota bacterium]|nr:CBS domain-containing protein [Methylomirabilota bacterium]